MLFVGNELKSCSPVSLLVLICQVGGESDEVIAAICTQFSINQAEPAEDALAKRFVDIPSVELIRSFIEQVIEDALDWRRLRRLLATMFAFLARLYIITTLLRL